MKLLIILLCLGILGGCEKEVKREMMKREGNCLYTAICKGQEQESLRVEPIGAGCYEKGESGALGDICIPDFPMNICKGKLK